MGSLSCLQLIGTQPWLDAHKGAGLIVIVITSRGLDFADRFTWNFLSLLSQTGSIEYLSLLFCTAFVWSFFVLVAVSNAHQPVAIRHRYLSHRGTLCCVGAIVFYWSALLESNQFLGRYPIGFPLSVYADVCRIFTGSVKKKRRNRETKICEFSGCWDHPHKSTLSYYHIFMVKMFPL